MVNRNMQVGENVLWKVHAAPTSIPILFITFIMTHILWLHSHTLTYSSERPTNVTRFLVSVLKWERKAGKVTTFFQKGSSFLLTAT